MTKHLTKPILAIQFMVLALLMTIGSQVGAKEISIICTYKGSYDENGYEELIPSDFSVRIKEDTNGNAIQASVTESMCAYKYIETYNDELIRFAQCNRSALLKADDKTPEGYLEIDRYTGSFKQYFKFPTANSDNFLMNVGTCKASSKKF